MGGVPNCDGVVQSPMFILVRGTDKELLFCFISNYKLLAPKKQEMLNQRHYVALKLAFFYLVYGEFTPESTCLTLAPELFHALRCGLQAYYSIH